VRHARVVRRDDGGDWIELEAGAERSSEPGS
jgi:hypothetical protein